MPILQVHIIRPEIVKKKKLPKQNNHAVYKKNSNIPAIIYYCGFICSCEMEIQEPMPAILQPVENLEVVLESDTARLTWDNPAHEGVLGAVIKYNNGTQTLNHAMGFEYGVIDVNTEYRFTVKVTDSEGNYSVGETVRLFREGPDPIRNLTGVQEGNSMILS